MDKVEKLRRKAGGSDIDIPAEQIGEYLKAAGMKPTHQDLLTVLRECSVDDNIKFSDLEKWLKRQIMSSKSKTRNPLLVNKCVGQTTASSYDLLGENHVYGVKIKRDKEHGADVIFKWDSSKSSRDDNVDMYVDRVKMNIDAVKKGRTTAKEFVEHSLTQRRYTSLKTKTKGSNRGQPLKVDRTRTFGMTKALNAAPIKSLLQSQYNPSVTDEESSYVMTSGTEKSKKLARKKREDMRTTKMTKAQRLRDTRVREALHPTVKPKFVMRQFADIPGRLSRPNRLSTTGRNVVTR